MLDTPAAVAPANLSVTRPAEHGPRGTWIAVLFAITSLLGAALLFMVQPLAAKLILPSYGGSATVWSTSSLLFQVLLLLGYMYAHISCRRLGARWQPRMHVLVLLVPLVFLPVSLPPDAAPDPDASPTLWLLRTLVLMVGVPFLVLSATGPVIQRWYAWSRGPRADDPYFLFAGSNLGSFVGLLCYPFVIEPHLTVTQQRWTWTVGLVIFLALMAACGLVVRAPGTLAAGIPARQHVGASLTLRRVSLWCALAFLPSCLMLAVTAHISTDVAPIPLLWVLPLALYLASFVAAFARRSRTAPVLMTRVAVTSAVLSGTISLVGPALPIGLVVAVDLTTVALVSYAAHARLAAVRPGTDDLTAYYLVISVGGALGGVVNGFLAPMLFNRVWEYGVTIAAAPLLMIGLLGPRTGWLARRYHPIFLMVTGVLLTPMAMLAASAALSAAASRNLVLLSATFIAVTTLAYAVTRAPSALALALLLGTLGLGLQSMMTSLALERTFYGSYRVLESTGRHVLVHGTTVHGTQFMDDSRRRTPTGYYARSGPLGQVMDAVTHRRTGIVGLGAGTIAAYGEEGDRFTFFEIDSAVRDIAADTDHFTFLADSPATTEVRVGDGRLGLEGVADNTFDLVILDAFSSDAIPVHLLTLEAMQEYVDHLTTDGSLVVHISNRIFDLDPVLQSAANDLGWVAVKGVGAGTPDEDATLSEWVVLTPDRELAARLVTEPGWDYLRSKPVVWTDDYASVLSILQ